MLRMSSMLAPLLRPDRARVLGAITAAAIGLLVAAHWIVSPSGVLDAAIAKAMPPIAGVFGWLLAHRATRPGWRAALGTMLLFDLGAVVVGSFIVGFIATLASRYDPIQVIAGTLTFGVLGIVIFGLPMLIVGLALVLAWFGAFRLLAGRLEVATPPRA